MWNIWPLGPAKQIDSYFTDFTDNKTKTGNLCDLCLNVVHRFIENFRRVGIRSKVQTFSGECKKSSASGLNAIMPMAMRMHAPSYFAADSSLHAWIKQKNNSSIYTTQYKNKIFLIYPNDIYYEYICSYIHH
jgi:hypothetical protein